MNPIKSLIFISLLGFLIFACKNKSTQILKPGSVQDEILKERGEIAAKRLAKALKSELKQAIETGSIAGAIEVCNKKALPLTKSNSRLAGEGVDIKRISTHIRNPKNRPDAIEQVALDYFESFENDWQKIPASYTQMVITENDTNYYYYKPMKVENLCLLCHGDQNTVSPEKRQLILQRYPDDKATGYKAGDFRGLIRVRFDSL